MHPVISINKFLFFSTLLILLACGDNNISQNLSINKEDVSRELQIGETDYYMSVPCTDKIIGGWGADGQQYQIVPIDTITEKRLVTLSFSRRYPESEDPYLKNIKRIQTSKFFIPDTKWKVYQFDSSIELKTSFNIDKTWQAVAFIESKSEQEAAIYLSMFATLHKKNN